MSVLNDLFQQILHSEERVRERFSRIRSVNKDIQTVQMQIQDAEDELKSMQGSLVVKSQRFAEEEEKLKSLQIRQNILDELRTGLEKNTAERRQQLDRVKDESDIERSKFIKAAKEFMMCHDLSGSGPKKREELAKNKLDELYKKTIQLKNEHETLRAQEREILVLRDKREKLIEEEKELNKQTKDLDIAYEECQRKTVALEQEKEMISKKPQNDPEFRRLNAELEAAKDGSMEGICEALKQELRELQQIYLKKELQKQKRLQQKQHGKVATTLI
ncbi:hypothetical protein QZH41_009311 [Actinostola sp. cb2023]|nr:hypothetical protein QZH41_009311 [Actinostola sp. cb2023]